MNLLQRLVGLSVLLLTIAVIGFTTLPRNIGKDAVWGARNSAQHLHIVGGATLPLGGELRIRYVALDGKTQNQVVKVPAGKGRELAMLGITLLAAPADTVTEISLHSDGVELFRSVPVISGTKEIYLRPVALMRVMSNPYVCSSTQGEDRVSVLVDPETNAVALHRESKGDGADLPNLFAVSDTQWDSDTGQSLMIEADGSLNVLEKGTLLNCAPDKLWGEALPVHHHAAGQYVYADAQSIVFFDAAAKPISMTVQRNLTETSWLPQDSKLTMWAGSDQGEGTLTFTVEDCSISEKWGLQQLKVVLAGPNGQMMQSCSGKSLDPFRGTWAGFEWQGKPIGVEVLMTLTSAGFTVEGKCAAYTGKLTHSSDAPFGSATLQLADRRAKPDCTAADEALDQDLAKALAEGLKLDPLGSHLVVHPVDTAAGYDPKLEFARNANLGT